MKARGGMVHHLIWLLLVTGLNLMAAFEVAAQDTDIVTEANETGLAGAEGQAPESVAARSPWSLHDGEWQGCSSLLQLAQWAQLPMVDAASPAVELGEGDVLWFLNPETTPDVDRLLAWVQAGNSVVWADEQAVGADLLRELGLREVPVDPEHRRFEQDRENLPILTPVGRHFLTEGVAEIVANHPRAWQGDGRPVLAWDNGAGLVWDVRLGAGRIVVIGDASMFINLMLPVRDNRIFAAQLMKYTCATEEACRLVLVTNDTVVEIPDPDGAGLTGQWPEWREWFNRVLDALTRFALPESATRMLGLLLAIGTALVLLTILPKVKDALQKSLAGSWTVTGRAPFESELARYSGKLGESSFVRPAALLRAAFVPLFVAGCAHRRIPSMNPDETLPVEEIVGRWMSFCEPEVRGVQRWLRRREVLWTLRTIRELPTGPVLGSQVSPLTAADFNRLYENCRSMLQRLGQDDEFRRRAEAP
jgi:hypothetical protein